VTSIVGRFLEHGRVYWFRNGGKAEVYLGSADIMPRNLDHRVEVLFPVSDPSLVAYLRDEVLGVMLADNVKARVMSADGSYSRAIRGAKQAALDSQAALLAGRRGRGG
jgi:polyphosphate kinase